MSSQGKIITFWEKHRLVDIEIKLDWNKWI